MVIRSLGFVAITVAIMAVGCASSAPPPPPAVVVAPPAPTGPQRWAQVKDFHASDCPLNELRLAEPEVRTIDGIEYRITGSKMVRTDGTRRTSVTIAVLGAIKDAEFATKENLLRAKAALKKAGGGIVVLNGDIAENDAMTAAMTMVGEVFDTELVLLHAGNSEWMSGFTDAYVDVEKTHPNLINMNWVRDVDIGGAHVLSLPGWSVKKFVKTGGCSYDADDVAALTTMAKSAAADGVVILTAHGPPRGPNKTSLDATFDYGNVGDEALAALLQQTSDDGAALVRFGLFSHILEAGGRATIDATTHAPLKLPMKKPSAQLYLNAGSASSSGLELHGKKTSRGMMALVTIDDLATGGMGTVKFIALRK